MKRFIQVAGISAVLFLMVASASAMPITFNTTAAGSVFVVSGGGFGSGTDTLLPTFQSAGVTASIVFLPQVNYTAFTPTGIDLGNFDVYCTGCSTGSVGTAWATFPAFTFNLIITDVTDGATGMFVGTSSGSGPGTKVFANQDPITVNWFPLTLGPYTSNATSGSFGPTEFTTTIFTQLVAPGSGTTPGQSTVQGTVLTAVPEPATFLLLGASLLGLGALRRKRA